MKTKHTARSAFVTLCIFIGLLVFFAGLLVALFASANPPPFVHERTRDVSDQFNHSNGPPRDPATSVYQAWVVHYNGPGDDGDDVVAMAADESGNVYVTGVGFGSPTGWDFATVKYNSAGEQQWIARYNGPDNDYDRPYAMAIDSFGNVYVTGYSGTADSFTDWTTIKYNPDGQEQWVARYNVCPRAYARGRSIAVDGSGNVYVTGNDGSLWAMIRYNSSGEEQWVTHHNSGESIAVAVDNLGNIYVTGDDYDYVTIKAIHPARNNGSPVTMGQGMLKTMWQLSPLIFQEMST